MSGGLALTLKLATSLDGRIAAANGESRWITGEASRREVHVLRARHDAVITGIGTVLADDPLLTARTGEAGRQPLRVILDSALRTPPSARLFDGAGPVLIFCGEAASPDAEAALRAAGAEVERAPVAPQGLAFDAVMAALVRRGMGSGMIEAGGRLAASAALSAHLVRIEWFRAPISVGPGGAPVFAGPWPASLAGAPRWKRVAALPVGDDLWERYERAP